jgi:eukaryotic-like serine/threonine-protein kinase
MRIGDHELLEPLGGGGMGVVFRARELSLNRIVALKLLRGGEFASDEEKASFLEEAENVARLADSDVVRIYRRDQSDHGPFFTMELMVGGNLADDLAHFLGDLREACRLVATLARAVDHAHAQGILHRDLKPANVLLDAERRPRLADFGAAKRMEAGGRPTRTGVVIGTANYMSPEQARGDKSVGPAADIWGLGAILYELLTGRPPFEARTYDATLRLVQEQEPIRPRTLRPELERDLEAICLKCLEKNPAHRYRSAQALAEDLGRYLRGEATVARPLGVWQRGWRWGRDRPATAAALGLLLLAAATTVAGALRLEESSREELLVANAYAARMAASSVLLQLRQDAADFQFRQYADQVQRPAEDPALVRLLEAGDAQSLSKSPLPMGVATPGAGLRFEAWLVLDRAGVARARWPEPPGGYFPKDLGQRDFFLGARALARAGKRGVHVSRVFVDEADEQARFAFSTPIYGADGTMVGVMVALRATRLAAGPLEVGISGSAARSGALVGLRDVSQPGKDAMVFLSHGGLPPGGLVAFDASTVAQAQNLQRSGVRPIGDQLSLPAPGRVATAPRYRDPLPGFEGRWLAGIAPVGDTGLFVVVQTRYDLPLNPILRALQWAQAAEDLPVPSLSTGLLEAAADDAILLGEVDSLTGPDAEFGLSTRNGVELAVLEANAEGGVKGRRVALRVYDDQSTPEGAARVTDRLLKEDRVVLILGEAASANSLAMAPVAQAAGVPMLTPSSTNPTVTEQGDFIFRACFTDAFQGAVMARFAGQTLGLKRVAVLVEDQSAYSEGLGREFERQAEAFGATVVARGSYRKGETDFRAVLERVQRASPDALYLPGYVAEVVRIGQQARAMGLEATLLGGDAWDSAKLFETGGGWMRGAYITNHYSMQDAELQGFVRQYQEAFGALPDARAALGYDAARLALDAINRATTLSGSDLRRALAQTRDFEGVTGRISIDVHRNGVKRAVVQRVADGRFELVTAVEP